MYKQDHINVAAKFLEKHALGTCNSDQDIINTFIEVLPELAAEYNFDKNDEIYDLLNSREVIEKADVIRCIGCWWYVRLSECIEVYDHHVCKDCTNG